MRKLGHSPSRLGLDQQGLVGPGEAYWNLPPAELLEDATFSEDPVFGILIPDACTDVPSKLLSPRSGWRDPRAYDTKARDLASLFVENFKSFHEVPARVTAAGPAV